MKKKGYMFIHDQDLRVPTPAGALGCLHAQLDLLTLREDASIVEQVPAVARAQNKGECPSFSADHQGGPSTNAMFLGPAFFDPSIAGVSGVNSQLAQAFILIHEAVHLVGDKPDTDFGGSKQLTRLLVDNCFPIFAATNWLGNLYK